MSKKITKKRWQVAQTAERICHDEFHEKFTNEEGKEYYRKTYEKYFSYLQMGYNHKGKTITEIGCADYPALEHCEVKRGILIEPMPSTYLQSMVNNRPDLEIIAEPVENITIPKSEEIWLLNVMQHVIDPDLFIEKCKEATSLIRFFEPIDWPIEIYHPHTFDFDYYKKHFPQAVRYEGNDKNFHTSKCAYGVWTK